MWHINKKDRKLWENLFVVHFLWAIFHFLFSLEIFLFNQNIKFLIKISNKRNFLARMENLSTAKYARPVRKNYITITSIENTRLMTGANVHNCLKMFDEITIWTKLGITLQFTTLNTRSEHVICLELTTVSANFKIHLISQIIKKR